MLVFLLGFCCIATIVIANDFDDACVNKLSIEPVSKKPKPISVRGKGHFSSPGFGAGSTYPNNALCKYQLNAPKGMYMRLKFNALDVEITQNCGGDSLIVRDLDPSRGTLHNLKTYCGNILPQDIVSSAHIMQIVLNTDGLGGGRGFNISYSLETDKNLCEKGEKQCRNRKCVANHNLCDGRDNCGDGTDEEGCNKPVVAGECGKPEIKHDIFADYDRVVGGNEAIYGSWPWMAELQMDHTEPNFHVCGGTLINSQWILTAAHCFDEGPARTPGSWRVHLGQHRKYTKDKYEQVRYVERIVIYDDISPSIFEENGVFDINHDIALLKLSAPVKFTKYVKPACLPEENIKLDKNSECYSMGWGLTRGTGGTDVLKQAYHPVQNDTVCKQWLGRQFDPKTMICAGSMGPLQGVCHGDSGGPLICKIGKEWTVAGVVSFSTDTNDADQGLCGLKGRPGVFNKVAVKVEYIRRMINKYS